MCNFIRANGVQAWNDYLAGRWRQPETLSWQATPHDAVELMLDEIAPQMKPGGVLYDLGCGDGRVVIAAARRGWRAVGVEIDPRVAAIARQNVRAAGFASGQPNARVRIWTGDATKIFLDTADAVTVYLFPKAMAIITPKVEMAPIVSYAHPIPGRPSRQVTSTQGQAVYIADGRPIYVRVL
jgi:SAM-dependent methyltransferase